MLKVASINQTCTACPSQWDAKLDDGRDLYIRYRWGHLAISFGVDGASVFGKDIGEGLDGWMSYDELKEHTKGVLDFTGVECTNKPGPLYLIGFEEGEF